MNYIEKVKEFNDISESPNPEIPQIAQRKKLRIDLLQEELDELKNAIDENNLIEILDAFCDLQYVLSGAILEFGMDKIFNEAFDRVHVSNMSKFPDNINQLSSTVEYYKERYIETDCKKINDKYIVYRKNDQKVLKCISWSKPYLNDLLP